VGQQETEDEEINKLALLMEFDGFALLMEFGVLDSSSTKTLINQPTN